VVAAGVGWQDRRLTVLALIHDEDAGPGVFTGYDEVASLSLDRPPRLSAYDAVMIFGGEANVDDAHDWLVKEKELIRGWLEDGTPLLGVCLGAQLIADVAGGSVRRLPQPEIGWHHVSGGGELPESFDAFEWHRYGFAEPPPGATELARNEAGCQAFRLGNALGIQFHAEVDEPTVTGWIRDYGPAENVDAEALKRETKEQIEGWNAFGRDLCSRFLSSLRPARPGAGPR
jgi:GMP synthase-like glutamine amidotransferase